jgi:hypothetical protein
MSRAQRKSRDIAAGAENEKIPMFSDKQTDAET